MESSISAAEAELRRADMVATSLARILRGRLRRVDNQRYLTELKRELQSFNAHTGRWSEQ
jgi:hypothetical protein